ncbi:cytochrome P450 [Maritimibacter dapengensis]|uniref:Cytochrome P450 n=1 Tax=Maritimibacter dapengensis TaxID=2836868 RepID=A0ABS6T491_9RHOB|nr:cytochrome P450 [Maritimibacter dapengensis]MBV7379964.1 cytochrome P450 [Maritimibacter dapengensis]
MAAEQIDELRSVWDPHDQETIDNYPAVWRELRETHPVAYSDKWGGFFTVMRYKDIQTVEKDHETFTATKLSIVPASPKLGLPRLPLQKDPPESERYRKAMNPSFKANKVATFAPQLRDLVDRLFAEAKAEDPGNVNFPEQIGEPMSQGSLGLLVGFDTEESLEIGRLSATYVHAIQNRDMGTAARMSKGVDAFATKLAKSRMEEPRDPDEDMVSSIMAYPGKGEPFDERELAGMVRLLLVGGHIASRCLMNSLAWHLATNPEHVRLLRNEPEVKATFRDEILRFYPANQSLARVATMDTVLNGTFIPKGTPVAMNYASANRDPRMFDDPETFDPRRSPNRHITFGYSTHMCMGQAMAKLQLEVMIEALIVQPGLAVVGTPTWGRWTEFGINTLTLDLRGDA